MPVAQSERQRRRAAPIGPPVTNCARRQRGISDDAASGAEMPGATFWALLHVRPATDRAGICRNGVIHAEGPRANADGHIQTRRERSASQREWTLKRC